MQKPRILIIDNSVFPTGAFASIKLITSGIPDFEFYFSLPVKSLLIGRLKKEGAKVFPVPYLELSRSFKSVLYIPVLIINSLRLLGYVRKNQIKIIHVNDMYNLCGVMLKLLKPDLKLIYHIRLLPDSYIRSLYSFCLFFIRRFADEIIAVSEAVQHTLQNRYKVTSRLIYGFLPAACYDDGVGKRRTKPDPVTLLYLANYTKGKGHEYAIDAVIKAHDKIKNLKMIMAGGVFGSKKNLDFRKHLESMVKIRGAADYIFFQDFVEDTVQLMKDCDIFLNFSESESFSRTCLEALTYGIPVIATDCGGPRDMIIPDKTGLLVPVGNTDAMTEAIIKLVNDEQLRKKFAEEGQKYAKDKFKPESSLQAMRTVYCGLTGISPAYDKVTSVKKF